MIRGREGHVGPGVRRLDRRASAFRLLVLRTQARPPSRPRLGRRSPPTPTTALWVVHNVLMPAMALRSALFPPVIGRTLFSRGTSLPSRRVPNWHKPSHFHTQLGSRPSIPYSFFSRKLLWVVPVAGGIALYAAPRPRESHNMFASPTLIPCPAPVPLEPMIMSPSESDRSLMGRILTFLRERLIEPILTAKRFVYLCCIFVPVLLAAPMLMIGQPEERLRGDRWGAVWWYGFLTRQMQCAGPTFIKVSRRTYPPSCFLYDIMRVCVPSSIEVLLYKLHARAVIVHGSLLLHVCVRFYGLQSCLGCMRGIQYSHI